MPCGGKGVGNRVALVMGTETEYAVCPVYGQAPAASAGVLEALMNGVRRQNVVAPAEATADFFLSSGGRCYVDTGSHVEYATPECASPLDLVRWEKAGEIILGAAADSVAAGDPNLQLLIVKNNVVPGLSTGVTWGCHENYMLECQPTELTRQLMVSHLATRTIYSGAGRLSCAAQPAGYELSQRAGFITTEAGSDTTGGERAIFNTRNEPLAGGDRYRAHLICGDSLRSHLGIFLKIGTTALLFAVATRRPDLIARHKVVLKHPVAALRTVSSDLAGSCTLQLASGGVRLARTIQENYLRAAEKFVEAYPNPPAWMAQVLECWRMVLDRHRHGPEALDTCLDSYIKHSLLTQILEADEFSWPELAAWAPLAEDLARELQHAPELALPEGGSQACRELEILLPPASFARVQAHMRIHNLPWAKLSRALSLYRDLVATDIAYHAVGKGNLFDELDRAGLLEHRLLSDQELQHAVTHPPSDTRAAIRGELIRRTEGRCYVYWSCVKTDGLQIDLPDPTQSSHPELWRQEREGQTVLPALG